MGLLTPNLDGCRETSIVRIGKFKNAETEKFGDNAGERTIAFCI